MKHNNYSVKSTYSVLVLITLLFAAAIAVNYYLTSAALEEAAQADSATDVSLVINRIEAGLQPVETALLSVKSGFRYENIYTRDLKKNLKSAFQENDQIISGHGIYFSPTADFTGENYSVISYFKPGISEISTDNKVNFIDNLVKSGLNETGSFWSEPFMHTEAGEMAVAFVLPANFILPDSMLTRGFVVATMRLKWLQNLIGPNNHYKSSSFLILSKAGKPLASTDNEYNLKDDVFSIAKTTQNAEFIELGSKMKSGKTGFMKMKNFGFKGSAWVSFKSVASSGWSVASAISQVELFSGLYFTTFLLIILVLLVLVIVYWLQTVSSRRIVKSLVAINKVVKEIGLGNVALSMPDIRSPKVLVELTQSLSAMQIDFRHYINSLERKPKEPDAQISVSPFDINKIRVSLLRNDFQTFTANRHFDMAALFRMSDAGCGNFYDFFMLNNHTLCFCTGDVTGKGLPASLFITRTITAFRTGNYFGEPLGKVISGINHQLAEHNIDSLNASFFTGILNLENPELIFCNASHPFPYLIKSGDLFEVHGTHGPALAMQPDHNYKTGKLKMETGDKLVLFSNGIIEAHNGQGDIFGKDWFEDVLRDSSGLPPKNMVEAIGKELESFVGNTRQMNDITLMVIQLGNTSNL